MPKKYPPHRKAEALELLALFDKVSTVQRLTQIPASTLHRWRRQKSATNADLSAKKDFPIAEKNVISSPLSQNLANTTTVPVQTTPMDTDSTQNTLDSTDHVSYEKSPAQSATEADADQLDQPADSDDADAASDKYFWETEETPAGVPGKTYPYPLEDDQDPDGRFEDFRELRDMLLDHARELAINLKPTDPDINLRSLALGRILDRVQHLDDLLPDRNPERIIRFEYVYDGLVHNVPPWKGIIEDQDEFRKEMDRKIIEEGVI